MNYTYKQLSSSDVLYLKELLNVFEEAFQDKDTYGSAIPSDDYLRALLSKQHFIALVALDNNKVVGGLAAYELEKFEQERREIYIYDLAVDEKYRRQGIATKLINELKHIAAKRKAYIIFVQADKVDLPAIELYRKFGKEEDVYQFDIAVD
jgi:aminoglycoside 3-N-acetyltransferase I